MERFPASTLWMKRAMCTGSKSISEEISYDAGEELPGKKKYNKEGELISR